MSQKSGLSRMFSALWSTINVSRKIILNLIFFGLIALFFVAITQEEDQPKIAAKSALVLNLSGVLVEQKTAIDPVDEFMSEALNDTSRQKELLFSDVVNVIDTASSDDRIQVIVLDLKNLSGSGLNKLESIGEALSRFKETGKKVIATGDYYDKSQYFLASYADEILLHPMGGVFLDGYNSYQLYFKSALEKLKVKTHIFRVGTYKSFVEPFIRDDMSEAAKTANIAWLNDLWAYYKISVASRRNIEVDHFDEDLSVFEEKYKASDYDFAQYALNYAWVDELTTREQTEQKIADMVGWSDNKRSFNQINYHKYAKLVQAQQWQPVNNNKIALIVARGNIQDGSRPAGEIGGDSTAKLLERARLDDNVKAVVLRIDSPGGSAFASEIIRRELDLLQKAQKPVIASMSSVAASGGYWIASSADEIWAHPTTITGSIGVFGLYMTLEESLEHIGIHTDGVSTTQWPALTPTLPLNESVKRILQKNTETAYRKFITLVSENRNMSLEQADKVAQGRVWSGKQALDLGLIDNLGTLAQAIESAAKLAGIDDYQTTVIEQELTPQQQLIKDILGQAQTYLASDNEINTKPKLPAIVSTLAKEYQKLTRFNDPQNIYVLCEVCE